MMKNREWGAVAYLSHSKYGVNAEISINNYLNLSNYWSETGCGAAAGVTTQVSTCAIPYGGASTYQQSTTGNITGVFDMSGGLTEHVMGNYAGTKGSYFDVLPTDTKYYDIYNFDSMSSCNLITCGGHALNETRWYSDVSGFVSSSYPWFRRGGYCSEGSDAGAFNANYDGGIASGSGFRSVLVTR